MKRRLTLLLLLLFCGTLSLAAQEKHDFGKDSYDTPTYNHFDKYRDKKKKKVLKLYPVPATRQLTFELRDHTGNKTYEITIYNFLGKAIDKITSFHNKKTLNLDEYYSGIYIYQLRDKHGHLVESGKFNVVKQ